MKNNAKLLRICKYQTLENENATTILDDRRQVEQRSVIIGIKRYRHTAIQPSGKKK